jgi:hypothetical protein
MGLFSGLGLVAVRLELNTRSNKYLHTTASSNLSPPQRQYHLFLSICIMSYEFATWNYEMDNEWKINYPSQAQDPDDRTIFGKERVYGRPASEMHSDKNRGSVTVARILRPH